MYRTPWLLALVVAAAPMTAVSGEAQPLVCFGTEPFWSLDLTEIGAGRFSTPDSAPVDYQGAFHTLGHRQESVWRGKAVPAEASDGTGDETGDLVAFLREGSCSDGMSDTLHPYAVNISLPGGRHLAGCCRLPEAPAASTGLEDGTWRLTELPGQTLPADQGVPSVRFEAGRLHGFSGCNRFMGSYTLNGDRLVPGTLGGTMMACAGSAMVVERRFLESFSGDLNLSLDGDTLTLTPVEGGDALRFEREARPSLEGSEWEVTGYNNGRQAVVSPMVGTQLRLGFEDGRVSGSAGCNRFQGTFAVDGNTLTIAPQATTRKQCEEPVMTQERAFLDAIEAVATWAIERGMLDLHRADGERALTANATGHQ